MSAFDAYVGEAPGSVEIDCYTSAYRVSGQTATRFTRVSDIVNLLSSTHLVITHATMSEFGAPSATRPPTPPRTAGSRPSCGSTR